MDEDFPFWVKKINEYNKLAEIAMVEVLESIEDERTFNNLSFMKNKLWNQLTTRLELCVKMFSENFFALSNFPYDDAIVLWKEVTRGDNEISGWILDLIFGFGGLCSSCKIVYVNSLVNLVWALGLAAWKLGGGFQGCAMCGCKTPLLHFPCRGGQDPMWLGFPKGNLCHCNS